MMDGVFSQPVHVTCELPSRLNKSNAFGVTGGRVRKSQCTYSGFEMEVELLECGVPAGVYPVWLGALA